MLETGAVDAVRRSGSHRWAVAATSALLATATAITVDAWWRNLPDAVVMLAGIIIGALAFALTAPHGPPPTTTTVTLADIHFDQIEPADRDRVLAVLEEATARDLPAGMAAQIWEMAARATRRRIEDERNGA